jgi:hypothetical protein
VVSHVNEVCESLASQCLRDHADIHSCWRSTVWKTNFSLFNDFSSFFTQRLWIIFVRYDGLDPLVRYRFITALKSSLLPHDTLRKTRYRKWWFIRLILCYLVITTSNLYPNIPYHWTGIASNLFLNKRQRMLVLLETISFQFVEHSSPNLRLIPEAFIYLWGQGFASSLERRLW